MKFATSAILSIALLSYNHVEAFSRISNGGNNNNSRTHHNLKATSGDTVEETDVVVIGSGLAGLSCAALLAYSNERVTVLESHDVVGGCAHSWTRRGFHFESGPSLYSGFSIDRSPNPLKNIFQIIEEGKACFECCHVEM